MLLFDTGWAGTYRQFTRALGEIHVRAQEVDCLFVSHFHPDHMGIAQEIADLGISMVVMEQQKGYIHSADHIFARDKSVPFVPVREEEATLLSLGDSREYLARLGIKGEILYTPGHSDDSISLWLDEGIALVGDLNPLYELPLHQGTQIEKSWEMLLARRPRKIYYGHARTAVLDDLQYSGLADRIEGGLDGSGKMSSEKPSSGRTENQREIYSLVRKMMKYIDKGYSLEQIQRKTGADNVFVEDVTRMYLTHRNVSVQGILDRIEIKNK